jgi:hypothetical protein
VVVRGYGIDRAMTRRPIIQLRRLFVVSSIRDVFVYFKRMQLFFVVSCIIDDSTYTKVLIML